MCGAVRYEAAGDPVVVTHCHCESCRRHSGAPAVTLVSFEEDRVRFTEGERAIYKSSPGVRRAFCSQCGTTLTWEGAYGGRSLIEFHIGTLDDPNAVVPAFHVFHGERLSWFDTADHLPRYRGSRFAGEPYLRQPARDGLPG
jgi:hypothetical protein